MDLIRKLLLKFEEKDGALVRDLKELEIDGVEARTIKNHVALMRDAGLIVHHQAVRKSGSESQVEKARRRVGAIRLSNSGHDFLDTIRDPKIWVQTKKGAEQAGGFTLDLLKDLAKGLVKKQVEEWTGVKL
jgi:hypothetical protein